MKKLYKLTFPNKQNWVAKRALLFTEPDDGFPEKSTYTIDGCTIIEVGNTPKKPIYDEDGNITNPDAKNADYSVDILSADELEIENGIKVADIKDWYHRMSGGSQDIPIPVVEPDSSWKKSDLQKYLTDNNIGYTKSMSKAKLLELL